MGRQFGWISGGRIVAALLQVVTLVLLARWSDPRSFGLAGIVLSGVVVVQTITDLGLPTFVLRRRASEPGSPDIARALSLNNITAGAMAVFLLLVLTGCAWGWDTDFLLLLPLAVWAAVDRNTDAWLGVALADGDAWLGSSVLLVRRLGALLVMVLLAGLGVQGLLAFSLSAAAVGVVVNLSVHRSIRRRLVFSPDDGIPARAMIRASFPFWVNSAAIQLRNLDVVLVGAIAGGPQAGFYAVASKVTGPLRILPTSLAAVLIPAAARAGTARLHGARRPILAVLGVMTVVYAVAATGAPWLVPVALGADYAAAVVPVQIVCTGLIFGAAASVLSSLLQGGGHGVLVARLAVAFSVVCLTGVAVGASFWGAVGAAVALAGSFLLQSVALAVGLFRVEAPDRSALAGPGSPCPSPVGTPS